MQNTDNYATNGDDQTLATVAGTQFNVKNINNSDMVIESDNLDNYAMSYGGPTVSGAQNNVRQIVDSDVTFSSNSADNYAIVRGNGTAVAGVMNQVNRVVGSDVKINNNATNNVAKVRYMEVVMQSAVSIPYLPEQLILTLPQVIMQTEMQRTLQTEMLLQEADSRWDALKTLTPMSTLIDFYKYKLLIAIQVLLVTKHFVQNLHRDVDFYHVIVGAYVNYN
eukprot:TRINITY_DN6230_c0_g1_i4.p2 TRINITY_DN6230_c0_g1~~TRINITY_DN6230_c0_g1_i4.p2  ORF type:complete len:222 (-),score=14.53 TRINITY_DN6230_c0_g1_i4:616-1281(-)